MAVPAAVPAAVTPSASPREASLPTFEAVRAAHRASDLTVLDRHGQPLQTLRVDMSARRAPWLPLEGFSPALREAVVQGEDRRFWQHEGVDWAALAAGAWATATGAPMRGASTLTMQLAALLDPALARPSGGRGAAAKLAQIERALALQRAWRREQVLEAYLNLVPLRGEAVGAPAAAWTLFGKHAAALDADESAIVAALLRAPNANAAAVERRACALLRARQRGCAALGSTVAQALARAAAPLPLPATAAAAPHAARQAWRQWQAQQPALRAEPQAAAAAAGAGAAVPPGWSSPPPTSLPPTLPTTLDAALQRLAVQALRRQLAELRGRQVADGAVVVLDNASGEVLVWVGSSGPASAAAQVDAVLARRQAGSTLKPFVYALAFEQRLLTADSRLHDAPLQLAAGGALYRPRNYGGTHAGAVTARQALASSLNVPAVQVGALLGTEAVFERMNALGLRLRETAGWHGHALVLGSAEVTLLDLANAYRTLANGGRHGGVRLLAAAAAPIAAPQVRQLTTSLALREAGDAPSVLHPAVAWLVADILADPAARAPTFGLDSPLVTRGWAAVKTGTSKDLRDNWCVGFTPRHTVAVWVGNAGGEPMHGVSGVTGAAPVWRELVQALHARERAAEPGAAGALAGVPPPPSGLHRASGEWFLEGTAPGPWHGAAAPRAFGITHPREGTVLALDPDIPPQAQRLVFSGAAGDWWLNGRRLGHGSDMAWTPQPGRHVLELRGRHGERLGRVHFAVRDGAPRVSPGAQSTRGPNNRSIATSMTMPHRL